MTHDYVKAAAEEADRYAESVTRLCNQRLKKMVEWFGRHFHKRTLHIRFGHGTELIDVDGKTVEAVDDVITWGGRKTSRLKSVIDALDDVVEMSDGYRLCRPDDIDHKPQDRESDDKLKPGDFNFRRAWTQWAKPGFLTLPADVRAIYLALRDDYAFLNQQANLSVRWPTAEEEVGDQRLRWRFDNVPTEILVRAIPIVHAYGHWSFLGSDGGAYWKFQDLAKQVLIAKDAQSRDWDVPKSVTDKFTVLSPEERAIDAGLNGSGLRRYGIVNVNFQPHLFCIGPEHFPKDGGTYIRPEQAPCGMRGCELGHAQHTSDRVLVIAGFQETEAQKAALQALAPTLEAHKIDGLVFVGEK